MSHDKERDYSDEGSARSLITVSVTLVKCDISCIARVRIGLEPALLDNSSCKVDAGVGVMPSALIKIGVCEK